ncbi:MAG: mycofactocin-coupled SDR family oxidoreductase [Marmoricola sp.]
MISEPKNRVALVTGAARGLGAAVVRKLCDSGYRVVAVDLCAGADHAIPGVDYALGERAGLEALQQKYGERLVVCVADVRDARAMNDAGALAVQRFGRLDCAVAAAAVMSGGRPMWEEPAENVEALFEIDVMGVWNTAAASVPLMLSGPDPSGCRFVAVGSAAGSRGLFHLASYTAAKHAVVGLVRGLAADLVGTGVTAVAVSPGPTGTPMLAATAALYGIEDPAELASRLMIREVIGPEELAETIAFCCSPAGRLLNGSVVAADGGFTG